MNVIPVRMVNMADPEVELKKHRDGIILRSPVSIGKYPDKLGEWLMKWAKESPDIIFVADRSGPDGSWRKATYQQFLTETRSIGQALLRRDLSADRPILILSDNGLDNALLLFSAMHVGIPVVPVSPAYSLMSQDYGKLKLIIELIKPGLIFAEDGAKFLNALSAIEYEDAEVVFSTNASNKIKHTSFESLIAVEPTDEVDKAFNKVGPDTIAKILFTSGSTGQPKGVINTQRMLCSNQEAISQVWPFLNDHPPITLDWLPWNHTFGGNHNLNMMLRNGGTMFVDAGKPMPGLIEQTVANLKEISPTIYFNVPRGFDTLLPFLEEDEQLRQSFFGRLDVLFYAAAALTQSAWERLAKQSEAAISRRIMMVAGWGSTETAPDCTQVHWPIEKAGVIGLPIPGTELKLVPNEEKMEIRVRGPNVTPGYWKRNDLTEVAFDHEGFYRIGDAAKFEDGDDPNKGIVFDGRVSENFKLSSGTWVFVGGLRTKVVSAASSIIQDVVITGHNRADLGLLIFPNRNGCQALCPDADGQISMEDLVKMTEVREALRSSIQAYNRDNPGSSTKITRAILMAEPPNIDANEITDKGYINQAAVLSRRSSLVENLYSDGPTVIMFD